MYSVIIVFIGIIIMIFIIKAIKGIFIEEHSNSHYPYNVRSIPLNSEYKNDNKFLNRPQLNEYCTRCGYNVDHDANYCPMCGSNLRGLNY